MNIKESIKTRFFLLIGCTLLLGCNSSNKVNTLISIDGQVYNSPKIKNFEANHTLKFEPYTGIYFRSSINGDKIEVILFTEDTEDLTSSSNLYNDDRKSFADVYEDVKDENVTSLGFRTFTPKNESFWNPILKDYESKLELSIQKEQKENGSIWKHNGVKFLEIEYHPKSGNILNIRIYPLDK